MSRVRGRGWAPPALVLAVVGLLGMLLGILVAGSAAPQDVRRPQPVTSFAVESVTFDDSREVEVAIDLEAGIEIVSQRGGVVTATTCPRSAPWRSGQAVVRVDGEPVIAIAADTPPYRDLQVGSTGPDVRAVEASLNRLGLLDTVDDYFGASTLQAWNALRERRGAASPSSQLLMQQLVWLPQERLRLTTCSARLGQRIAPGQPIATTESQLTGLRIASVPPDLTPGARILTVAGVNLRADRSGGAILDGQRGRLTRQPEFRLSLRTAESQAPVPLAGTLALADPISAISVPISAVVGSTRTCVVSAAGDAIDVAVLTSSLGRSVVTSEVSRLPRRVLLEPPPAACDS